ncbi:type III pantothenate kinase [Planctomycetota bacterium]|nr:type III pantothenate kinase [Planctomycetota bacterium]
MDLIIDVGNTRAHLALFEGDQQVAAEAVPHGEAMRAGWAAFLGEHAPTRAAVVDVNPPVRLALVAWLAERGLRAKVLGHDLPVAIPLQVAEPEKVGGDRIANALWARQAYPGQTVAVFDLGTAVTLDVVSSEGAFVGGSIAPGLRTAAWSLNARTAALPEVRPAADAPAIGVTTEGCIASGLLWGAVGLVRALYEQASHELGADPVAVATGGDAALVSPHCPFLSAVVPDLTLQGLRIALSESTK